MKRHITHKPQVKSKRPTGWSHKQGEKHSFALIVRAANNAPMQGITYLQAGTVLQTGVILTGSGGASELSYDQG